MNMGNNVANVVTCARIVMSPFLVMVSPYSWTFLVLFILCGLTDVLDGWLARRYHVESEFGGKLDSIADLMMFVALSYVVVSNVDIPMVVWAMVIAIIVIKFLSFMIGRRNGFFGFRHSQFNRITGALVFASIPFLLYWDPFVTGVVVCTVALFAALDEMFTNLREAKGILKVYRD